MKTIPDTSSFSGDAEYRMHLAFNEALQAIGPCRPNPAVGAVLVQNDQVIAKGFTQPPGGPHAEVVVLRQAREQARGASLYVTLEPCCHYGRTPPCSQAIIEAGVRKVFISVKDPNPQVNGGGIQQLRQAGIEVEEGVWADYGEEFYRGYFHWVCTQRPWVDVKIAQSLDGYIAGTHRQRIQLTGEKTGLWVHHQRALADAILVGGGTLRYDDPSLTVRQVPGNHPVRIVVNGDRELSSRNRLFQDHAAPTRVFSRAEQPQLPDEICVQRWPDSRFAPSWEWLVTQLGQEGMHRILFELGATVAGFLLPQHALWNRFFLLTAPKLLGEGLNWNVNLPANWKDGLYLSRFEPIGCDFLTVFEHVYRDHSDSRHHQKA